MPFVILESLVAQEPRVTPSDSHADLQSFLPLTAPEYNVLLALGEEALHGYAMMQSIEERSGGREALLPGTLYATIARMVQRGLLDEVEAPIGADRRRRYYQVSTLGRAVARAESSRLERLLGMARQQAWLTEEG
jgi:DNA-binding PadR family transcriptional regulator